MFAEWDEWRPKPHEHIEDDISEKTAEQASVDEGKGEKVGESPTEDIQTLTLPESPREGTRRRSCCGRNHESMRIYRHYNHCVPRHYFLANVSLLV